MRDRAFLFSRAKAMRREPTRAEQAMWRLLRNGGLDGLKFRRQVPLGGYIADFACFDPKLIVECDGGQHGGRADQERDAWFRAQGFRVIRMWNAEVLDDGDDSAMTTLRLRLAACDPSPSHR